MKKNQRTTFPEPHISEIMGDPTQGEEFLNTMVRETEEAYRKLLATAEYDPRRTQ